MTGRRFFYFERFIALLTILSFSFTQTVPAWAMRSMGAEDPAVARGIQAGLEEVSPQGVGRVSASPAHSADFWRGIMAQVGRVPSAHHQFTNIVLEVANAIRTSEEMGRLPDQEKIVLRLQTLIKNAPSYSCATCGAHAVGNLCSNPQLGDPENLQTGIFNEVEALTALLVAYDLARTGDVLSEKRDQHEVLANSLLALQVILGLFESTIPAVDRKEWLSVTLTESQLKKLAGARTSMVLHVDGNHFTTVTKIEKGMVTYTEPVPSTKEGSMTGTRSLPMAEFLRRWKNRKKVGVALIGIQPGTRIDVTKRLDQGETAKIVGCCGINATFGRFGGIRKVLDAVLRLSYRAPDDTGITIVSDKGLVVRKVKGAPRVLIEAMVDPKFSLYQETVPFAADSEEVVHLLSEARLARERLFPQFLRKEITWNGFLGKMRPYWDAARQARRRVDDRKISDVKKERVDLLKEEDLQYLVPSPTEIPDAHLTDRTRDTLQAFYEGGFDIGIRDVGGIWAGWQYLIEDDNLQELIDKISKVFDLTPEFVKIFVRYKLDEAIKDEKLSSDEKLQLIEDYDLLVDRKLAGRLTEDQRSRWEEIWNYVAGQSIVVPADYNRDPVRHIFRLQGAFIGSFADHPEWESEVQDYFDRRMPGKGRRWREYWERERKLNMPGHAYASFVNWFHDWAHKQDLIPQELWDQTEKWQYDVPALGRKVYGVSNHLTAKLLVEIIIGHGRWAMTGDPSQWNAHPQNTESRVLVHNGLVKATTNEKLRSEHIKADPKAYIDDEEHEIKTDTKTIVEHWQKLFDDYRQDFQRGRVDADGTIKMDKAGSLNRLTVTEEFNRAQVWNGLVKKGITNPDELAFRVALLEMAPGSELGIDAFSLYTPLTQYVTSHDRPVDIVIYTDTRTGEQDVMVTSDMAAGIGLFPAPEVAKAANDIARLQRQADEEIDRYRERRAEEGYSEEDYVADVKKVQARLDEAVGRIEDRFGVQVYHLKGQHRFAKITRRLNGKGDAVVDVRVSYFNGDAIPMEADSEKVSPALGYKGDYRTFMEFHIDEIPGILLKAATRYIQVDQGTPVAVDMDAEWEPGSRVSSPDEAGRIFKEGTLKRHGLNPDLLRARFGEKLEGLRRLFLIGVGSSWRDALVAKQLFEELLPGVEILVYDPVDMQNLGYMNEMDPKHDLAVGMSWSGSTASTVKLFDAFRTYGVVSIGVTGKISSDLGRTVKDSGGTIDVLSGPETTIATTKGFQSTLYTLSLLGVQMSQLQDAESVAGARATYVAELWRNVDLVYEIITEKKRRADGKRLFLDLEDPDSLVRQLAERWKGRQKFLVVGSMNNPIHIEAELKGEEICWILGQGVDVDDESWLNTLAWNAVEDAPEAEKVSLAFNMTDPNRLEEFMDRIRMVTAQGIEVLVQTIEEDNLHLEELRDLETRGLVYLVTVPKVSLPLQGLIDIPLFFRFGVALARARGISDAGIDASQNLAKSVTVSGSREREAVLREAKTSIVTMQEQADPEVVRRNQEALRRYETGLQRIRSSKDRLSNDRERAVARFPLVLRDAIEGALAEGAFLGQREDQEQIRSDFGDHLGKLDRIVIVTSEEATEYAAMACQDPLRRFEIVNSGDHEDIYEKEKGLLVRFADVPYRVVYGKENGRYEVRYDEKAHLELKPKAHPPVTEEFTVSAEDAEVTVNGKAYLVGRNSFLVNDKKKLMFGLSLKAKTPDLVGVQVNVMRTVDRKLRDLTDSKQPLPLEINPDKTLVVVVSRSNNDHHSEDKTRQMVRSLLERGVRVVTISDPGSAVRSVDGVSPEAAGRLLGHISLPVDTDDTSLYGCTYACLLALGTRLGALRGVDTALVAQALRTIPGAVSQLYHPQRRRAIQGLLQALGAYLKVHIIGGGQAFADGKEFARLFRSLGIFAEGLLNDSAWHGPLAPVDPNRSKFLDTDRKTGVNPNYSVENSVLVFMLATDASFFDSATTDTQVYDSRNGRVIYVAKEADYVQPTRTESDGAVSYKGGSPVYTAITAVGPVQLSPLTEEQFFHPEARRPEGVLTVSDVPDIFGNFVMAGLANMVTSEFTKHHTQYVRDAIAKGPQLPIEARNMKEIPSSFGPLYGIHWGENAQGVVNNNRERNLLAQIAGLFASNFFASGARGAIAVPAGVDSYGEMAKRHPEDVQNLEAASSYVRNVWARAVLTRQQRRRAQLSLEVAEGRVGRIRLANGSVGWILTGECLKNLLTVNYGKEVNPLEVGSGTAMLLMSSEGASWVLPEELEEEYAATLVTYISPEMVKTLGRTKAARKAKLRQILNPTLPVRDGDHHPIEEQLEAIALLNGIPKHKEGIYKGRPDMSYLRVEHLLDRDRERILTEEYERLHRERGLQIWEFQDGTITSGMAAGLPPLSGRFTPENPLRVQRTTPLAVQGMMLLDAAGAGALPKGVVMSLAFLSQEINGKASIGRGSQEEPIRNATRWSEETEAVFRRWLPDQADALLKGEPLLHVDIPGEAVLVFIPITPVGILGDPIPNVQGIRQVEQEGLLFRFPVISAQGGSLFVERKSQRVFPEDSVPLVFPSDIKITPESERRGFLSQLVSVMGSDQIHAEPALATLTGFSKQFEDFRESGTAQVAAYPYQPVNEGVDPQQSLLLIVAPDEIGFAEKVQGLIARQGANILHGPILTYRGIVADLFLIDNKSVEDLKGVAQEVEKALRASRASLPWQAALRSFLEKEFARRDPRNPRRDELVGGLTDLLDRLRQSHRLEVGKCDVARDIHKGEKYVLAAFPFGGVPEGAPDVEAGIQTNMQSYVRRELGQEVEVFTKFARFFSHEDFNGGEPIELVWFRMPGEIVDQINLSEALPEILKPYIQSPKVREVENGESEIEKYFGEGREVNVQIIAGLKQAYREHLRAYDDRLPGDQQRQFRHFPHPEDPSNRTILMVAQRHLPNIGLVVDRALKDKNQISSERHTFKAKPNRRVVMVAFWDVEANHEDLERDGIFARIDRGLQELYDAAQQNWVEQRPAQQGEEAGLEEAGGLGWKTDREIEVSEQSKQVMERDELDRLEHNGIIAEGGGARITIAPGVLIGRGSLILAQQDAAVRIAAGAVIEPGALIVAQPGQTVEIGEGSRILKDSQLGYGNIQVGKQAVVDAVVADGSTRVVIGDGTTFTRGSKTVLSNAVLLPVTVRMQQPDGPVVEKSHPVKVILATSIFNSVVWGSTLYQDVVVRDTVVGPFAILGNHVSTARSILFGTAAAHHNDLLDLIALPVDRHDLEDPNQRVSLQEELSSVRFKGAEAAGSNIGAGGITSNYNPRHGGTKGPSLVWGGANFGVNSVLSAPVEVGPRVLVGSSALISGQKALTPGTLVLPQGVGDPKRAIRPQYINLTHERLGDGAEEDLRVRLQGIRLLAVLASVAASGVPQARSEQEKIGYRMEAELLNSVFADWVKDLNRYLDLVGLSAVNLAKDLAAKPEDETIKRRLEEQQRVIAQRTVYERASREASDTLTQALALATGAGLEEHTMAAVDLFRGPQQNIIELKEGTPALSLEMVSRGLDKVRNGKPLVILFAAGTFSRFVESVNKASPHYAQVARERGLANSDGDASKLTAPLGVSGFGPTLRILEAWSEVGARAGRPIDVVIVDSTGNHEMLLNAIEKDRSRPNPRVAWNYLNLLPKGIPVDQGEGLQVQFRDTDGNLKPLFQYNLATGKMDEPVMRPAGEFGAFFAGIQAAQRAGISIRDRDVIPIYGDQAMLYSDPNFVAAVLGHLDNAEITGLNGNHRYENGQWVPSGGVWVEAQWQGGVQALAIAERNVRDPGAVGVYNPKLDASELAAIAESPDKVGFPFSMAAPIFDGRFVEEELLSPERMSARLSRKTIQVQTGESSSQGREVFVTELELTEAIQIGTQHPAGGQPKWRAQMLVTKNEDYQGVKFYQDVEPANQEIFHRGERFLRSQLGNRVEGDLRFVQVSPSAGGFRGEGRLKVTGDVGIVIDRWGLWIHKGQFAPEAPQLFTEEGRLLIPADSDRNILLDDVVEITPQTYDQLTGQAGLEEKVLTQTEIEERLQPLRARPAVKVVALDVDGVATAQDEDLSDASRDAQDLFIRAVPDGWVMFLTDIGPGPLRDRVDQRLTAEVHERRVLMPLSGGEYIRHIIPDVVIPILDKWVAGMGGKETVLRMEDKRKERAAGQISDASWDHGFDINRTRFNSGDIVAIDLELDRGWLQGQKDAHHGLDPRDGWVAALQKELRQANVPESVVKTLHKAGRGSITWTPAKGEALRRWVEALGINPEETIFVDDSASNFKEFPNVANWKGTLVYIGAYDEELARLAPNVIQVSRPGEGKPANGEEITRAVIDLERSKHEKQAGLEQAPMTWENLRQGVGFTPSAISLGEVHIVDGEIAPVGLLAARVQKDPVVILASDFEEERWFLSQGFVGDNRIILNVNTFGTIEAARAAAAQLFPGLAPRYYRADQKGNLPIWLAGLLERYNVKNLTLKAALAIVDDLNRAYAA